MARLGLAAAEAMGASSGERTNWFTLENDRQVARVRILANSVDDLDVFSLHRIALNNGERYINCLRDRADDPTDKCPLCAAGTNRATPRVFLQLYNVDDGKVYIWDRGIQIIQKLRSLERRIQGPLYQTIIEIERNGRKGDQHTTYEFYQTNSRDTTLTLEQLPAKVDLEATGLIMNESAESIKVYLETGDFPGWGVNSTPKEENVTPRPAVPANEGYTPRPGSTPAQPQPPVERVVDEQEIPENPAPAPKPGTRRMF